MIIPNAKFIEEPLNRMVFEFKEKVCTIQPNVFESESAEEFKAQLEEITYFERFVCSITNEPLNFIPNTNAQVGSILPVLTIDRQVWQRRILVTQFEVVNGIALYENIPFSEQSSSNTHFFKHVIIRYNHCPKKCIFSLCEKKVDCIGL